jgi:hypothetical protein
MYDIPFDRSFLQLSNGIRYVMPSTDTKAELTAKASMAQSVSQPAVYANGLIPNVLLSTLFHPQFMFFSEGHRSDHSHAKSKTAVTQYILFPL